MTKILKIKLIKEGTTTGKDINDCLDSFLLKVASLFYPKAHLEDCEITKRQKYLKKIRKFLFPNRLDEANFKIEFVAEDGDEELRNPYKDEIVK